MNRKGFTLIELLVVIAIIAILSAILFPVFGRVREQVRQTQCMTQMHQINVALKLYHEDNGRYPACLFGFAEVNHTANQLPSFVMANGSTKLQSTTAMYYKPLFNKQKYLNDNTVFVCPDTRDKTQAGPGDTATTQLVTSASYPNAGVQTGTYNWTNLMWLNMGRYQTPSGVNDFKTYNGKPVFFYKADNYDVQPKPNATLDGVDTSGAYEVHYALDWTGTSLDLSGTQTKTEYTNGVYTNQLKYGSRCDESHTVVTWCSDHALNAHSDKVLILTLGGSTKAVDKNTFYNAGSKQGPLNILR